MLGAEGSLANEMCVLKVAASSFGAIFNKDGNHRVALVSSLILQMANLAHAVPCWNSGAIQMGRSPLGKGVHARGRA